MTISDRIENIVGTYPYGDRMEQVLAEAVRLVIGELPEAVLTFFASEETDDGTTGVDVSNKRILRAHKEGYAASWIEATTRSRLITETIGRPGYYVLANTAFVVPDGGTVVTVAFPTVLRSATTITGFPTMLVDLVIERASLLIMDRMMVDTRNGYGTTVTLPTAPSAPAAPAITYVDASQTSPSTASISALPTAPVYTAPALAAKPTVPTVGTLNLTLKVDGATALTPPSMPSAPSFSFSDALAATVGTITVAALPTPPTYNTPSFGGSLALPTLPSLDLTTKIDGVTALNPPAAISAPAIAFVDAAASAVVATTITALGTPPVYTKPTFGGAISAITSAVPALADLSTKLDGITALTIPTAPNGPSLSSAGQATITVDFSIVDAAAPAYTKNTTWLAFTDWDVYFDGAEAEDPEMMAEIMRKAGIELQEIQTKLQDEQNEFAKEAEIYRAKVQKVLRDAEIASDEARNELTATDGMVLQNYIQTLSAFDRQLAHYDSQVATKVQEFNMDLQRAMAGLAEAQRLYLQQYSLDVQNETVNYQKLLATYEQDAAHKIQQAQLTLQEALTNARNSTDVSVQNEIKTLEALIADFQADAQVYQTALATYKEDIDRQLQTFTMNFQKALEPWREQQRLYMESYGRAIQAESDAFSGAVQDHLREADRLFEQARIDAQRVGQQAQLTTDVSIQNEAHTIRTAIEEYGNSLQRASLNIQLYQLEVDAVIQKFVAGLDRSIRVFEAEGSLDSQRYSVLLQNARAEFEKEVVIYQAGVERNALQAQILRQEYQQIAAQTTDVSVANKARTMEALATNYQSVLGKHRQDVESYNTQVQAVLNDQRTVTESVSAKLRMMNFDRQRQEERYQRSRSAFMRVHWPQRSFTIQQPVI